MKKMLPEEVQKVHERVQSYIDQFNMGLKVITLADNTATAKLAAESLGVTVGQIAKSLLFKVKEEYVLVMAAGDVKIKMGRLKAIAGGKPRLATPEEVKTVTSYPVGGVCPFALANPIPVLLDKSLGDYEVVYSAAGTPHSALPLTLAQLEKITGGKIADLSSDS